MNDRPRICWIAAVGLMTVVGLLHPSRADVPRLIHYQGKLVTSAGAIVPGPVDIRARLYDSPSAPTPILFDENHATVQLNRGLFSILLGSQTGGGVPDSVFAGSAVFLGIAVDGAAELTPRIRIATAPYAGKTRSAEQLVKPNTTDAAVSVSAAGHVGVGGAPDPSAAFDINMTSGGLAPPRLTAAQRDAIASPVIGLMVFNTTTNCLNMWTGITWKQSCFDCEFVPPTPSSNAPICEGDTLSLFATNVAGATFAWTGPNGFSSSQQNPTISNATAGASGPYSVTATLLGCTSAPQTTVASVNAIPSQPAIGSNSPICVGGTLLLSGETVPGATYSWAGPNGFTSSLEDPSIPNVTAAASGMYQLTVTVNGCESPSASTSVAVNQTPATPGSISGPTTVCANVTGQVYSITDVPGATSYTWTAPSGATVASGQGTAFATVNFGGSSGNMMVTASNACGTSSASSLTVTVSGGSGSQTFNYNGSQQSFVVPACVSTVHIVALGGQGGNEDNAGGEGGRAEGDLAVTPGETLYVYVGASGANGGFNGGGTGGGGWAGGRGGGASDVRRGGTALSDRRIVAGGGGAAAGYAAGDGGWGGGHGGNAGGLNGDPGITNTPYGSGGGPGGGGTQSAGGSAGSNSYENNNSAGSLGQGGNGGGNGSPCGSGGAGGGGYYGGGGGGSGNCGGGGGGGGSSYIGGVTGGTTQSGQQAGNGQVVISW